MLEEIEPLIKLSNKDKISFDNFIKQTRKIYIQPPKDTAKKVVLENKEQFEILLKNGNISECIEILREKSYEEFFKRRSCF